MHERNAQTMLKLHDIDLNLLRLFDAVYRARSVSRAAEALGLTQPAASQGLTRLRLLLKDALFVRAPGGVAPTPRAERLSRSVQAALSLMEAALNESDRFDPVESQRSFRIHMSDIGEARFLPDLMAAVQARAPGVRIETRPLPSDAIAQALDEGHIDLAFGFLPSVKETRQAVMLSDRYIVLLRAGHPFTRRKRSPQALLDDLGGHALAAGSLVGERGDGHGDGFGECTVARRLGGTGTDIGPGIRQIAEDLGAQRWQRLLDG